MKRHVALVTGGNRNIGAAIALAMAARGCDVIINSRTPGTAAENVATRARSLGARTIVIAADVSHAAEVRRLAERAHEEFDRVDVVVNNAAIRPERPFLDMSEDEWRHVLDVDLTAAFLTARAFAPAMVEQRWGRIINLTGMNALQGYPGRAHVATAKHGLWGLTKALARELGPYGVTANAVSPGPIDTERDDQTMDAHIRGMVARVPLGRLGTPHEIAAVCAFLASDDGAFVSGQMIAVNGAAAT